MAHACLLASHEGDCSHHHRPYAPAGSPRFLMEVREGGADGLIDLESPAWCEEKEFRRSEWHSMVKSALIHPIQSIDTEVEVKHSLPGDPGVFQWLILQFSFLFLEPQQHQFLVAGHQNRLTDNTAYHILGSMLSLLGLGEKNPLGELVRKSAQVCKSSRYVFSRKLVEMLQCMFPPQSISKINSLYIEAVDSHNSKWVKMMKQIIQIFSPNGPLGEALVVNREERTDFKSLCLGPEYEAYFGTKQAIQMLGIKKEVNALTLPIFEGFFIKLLGSLFCFKQCEKKGSWKETFENDDFHYYILRNPILHILREWLIYTRTRPVVFNRIVNVMEALLLRQPIFRFKKGEFSLSIKSYHFYALYLLIQWKTSNPVWQFLSFIVDYIETKQKNFNIVFVCWLRIHLILLRRGSAYEMGIRRELQEGLFTQHLSRVRIQSIQKFSRQIEGIQDQDYLNHLFIQVDSLLSKELWTPTPLFLVAVLTVMLMIEILDEKQQKFQSSLMSQIGKVILKVEHSLKRKEDAYMNKKLEEIKSLFHNIGGKFDIDETLDETMSQENRNRGSLFSQQNRGSKRLSNVRPSFVSYQRGLSPWQRPIQGSQSHMFYVAGFMIAKAIDKLKGVNQEYPSTNLRFLASLKTIAILLAAILILILLFR